MSFGKRLKEARTRKGFTQVEVARKLGIDDTTISKYENNKSEPDNEILIKLSELYNKSINDLLGTSNQFNEPPLPYGAIPYDGSRMEIIPILGTIRAGEPIFMNETIEGYDWVEPELLRGRKGFVLIVKGNSMSGDNIYDGYKVVVVLGEDVEPTDIAVVAINGEDATLKRVKYQNDICVLSSSNVGFEPMIYPANEVKVIGKVIRHWKDY